MLLRIFLIIGLVRLLMLTQNPHLCAGIYTGVCAIFAILSNAHILAVILGLGLLYLISFTWFWLLDRYEDKNSIWFPIFFIGVIVIILI